MYWTIGGECPESSGKISAMADFLMRFFALCCVDLRYENAIYEFDSYQYWQGVGAVTHLR